jgi:hypothetical protein
MKADIINQVQATLYKAIGSSGAPAHHGALKVI